MIKRVLVPLDGSQLAERALVIAGGLAESLAGTVALVRVVAPLEAGRLYAPHLADQLEQAQVQEAREYLEAVSRRLEDDRLRTELHVAVGPVARTLVGEAKRLHSDLIVLTSHGMGGLGDQVFGSVAMKLLQSAPCPVLVVRSTAGELEAEEEAEERQTDEALLRKLVTPSSRGNS
jgi:nucleotide-binding universal stress UspA family protein